MADLTLLRVAPILAIFLAIPLAGIAQVSVTPIPPPPDALDWQGKLQFHAQSTYGPWAILSFAAYAGFLQETNSPREWGQGGDAYAERFASTLGWSAIHTGLAFGLDTTLHEDPRYYRMREGGLLRRVGHALRGTILTRTDSGGETFSVWRVGSAYGSAYLSNLWYPARLDTFHEGFVDGSIGLGLGFAANLGTEFWPDIKSKLFGRRFVAHD